MKIRYYILIIFFIVSTSFTYGYFVKRNEIFPYKIIKKKFGHKTLSDIKEEKAHKKEWYKRLVREKLNKIIIINNYQPGYYIYNDRLYSNNLNEENITGKTLIQISRHRQDEIELLINKDVFIYRSLCDLNDNSSYEDWEVASFDLEINGMSCIHKKVVKKKFLKGVVKLNSGGPISSDPIFLDMTNNNEILIKGLK